MARPVQGKLAAWTSMQSATRSDAFSTAFMIMVPHEIELVSGKEKDLQALVITQPNSDILTSEDIHFFGQWDNNTVSLIELEG
jgi:thiamine biosynthesis lipoprotein ApbE